MEDRDGKKPFTIPKTHSSSKDVLISEKTDSRNVTELFDDIKPCSSDAKFDFRRHECKSCDTIRNPKLHKIYHEKRIKMKQEQDPIERYAFQLVSSRDIALTIATEGLSCEQLPMPTAKYLGNPKDGIHLSRRPDVLLTSTTAQGSLKFGLLICKVLLGKGYTTLPSTTNQQLAAQLHYDHHFCKVQPTTKEQRSLGDRLANSMIYCYEHENFQTLPRPSQILPIAVLWYELSEKFPLKSPNSTKSISQESQQRSGKMANGGMAKKKFTSATNKSVISLLSLPLPPGDWENFSQDTAIIEQVDSSPVKTPTSKYPGHFMLPFHRQHSLPTQYTSFSAVQSSNTNPTSTSRISSRDPRLFRSKRPIVVPSETTPISPSHSQNNLTTEQRSTSDLLIIKQTNERTPDTKTKSDSNSILSCDETSPTIKLSSSIRIPLESNVLLNDPRIQNNTSRKICYLEANATKHAIQKQKRLNHYHDPKSGSIPKTTYTLVPFIFQQISFDDQENKTNSHPFYFSSSIDCCPSLCVSVVDSNNFGFVDHCHEEQMSTTIFIDLNENENENALERLQISNETIEQEKQSSSEQVRIHMRERRRRKMQQRMKAKKKLNRSPLLLLPPPPSLSPELSVTNIVREKDSDEILSPPPLVIVPPISMSNSKLYISTGRQIIKEHPLPILSPTPTRLPSDMLDFLCREYHNENRPHVKKLLAELTGIFIEKYGYSHQSTTGNNVINHFREDLPVVDSKMTTVVDMEISTPPSESMGDYDERFRIPTPPPPPPIPSVLLEPFSSASLLLTQTLPNQPNKVFDDPTYNDRCREIVEKLREQQKQIESTPPLLLPPPPSSLPTDDLAFKACLGQIECSSSESSCMDDTHQNGVTDELPPNTQKSSDNIQQDPTRSYNEFIELLAKKTSMSNSSSPPVSNYHQRSHHQRSDQHYRRRSYDENEEEEEEVEEKEKDDDGDGLLSKLSSRPKFHRQYAHRSPPKHFSRNDRNRNSRSPRHPSKSTILSSRTVTVVSNRLTVTSGIENQLSSIQDSGNTTLPFEAIIDSNEFEQQISATEEHGDEQQEPTVKRIKVDLIPSSSTSTTDWMPESSVAIVNETSQGDPSSATVSTTVTDEHDYRLDLDERRRAAAATAASSSTLLLPTMESIPLVRSPHSRSRSKSKDRNGEHDRGSLLINSRSSSLKNPSKPTRQRRRSSASSSDRTSPNAERYRRQPPPPFRRRPSIDDVDQRQIPSTRRNFRQHPLSSKSRFNPSPSNRHTTGTFNNSSYRGSKPSTYSTRNKNGPNTSNNVHLHRNHQRYNYNHQSMANHSRFSSTTTAPGGTASPGKVPDYNTTNNYSFQTSPTDRHYRHRSTSPPTRTRNTLPMTIEDLNSPSTTYYDKSISTYHHSPRLCENVLSTDGYEHLSISSETNYHNSLLSKPSETIERLQMLIQNKPNTHFEHTQGPINQSVNSTTSFSSSSPSSTITSSFTTIPSTNSSHSHWQTPSFASTTTTTASDSMISNNPSFSYNDAEQALQFVQRLRN